MKHKVIEFFQNLPKSKSEQFNKAFELYRQSPEKHPGTERMFNVQGFSDENLKNLLYDLQKLYNLKDVDLIAKPKAVNVVVDFFKSIDEADATPIREEFPFLNDKNCPNEMYILVGKKIAAWKRYQELHAKIQLVEAGEATATEEELKEMGAEALANYNENQEIYEELNAYKETGEILGKHPIFSDLALQKEVNAMNTDELIKFKNASVKYFSTNKTQLTKAEKEKDAVAMEKIKTRVAEREKKLKLVNQKLGLSVK